VAAVLSSNLSMGTDKTPAGCAAQRRCKTCGELKPLDAAHFYTNGERRGRVRFRHRCILCYLAAYGRTPDLPTAPLLERLRDRYGPAATWRDIGQAVGVGERTLYHWRHGRAVHFGTADRILQQLGLQWWDVWPPERFPDIAHRLEVDGVR
jgi:hypothetical protein